METIQDCLEVRKLLRKTLGLVTNDREDRFFCHWYLEVLRLKQF